jgi:hypothetical protein
MLNSGFQAVIIQQATSTLTMTKDTPTRERVTELEGKKHAIKNAAKKESVLWQTK